MFYFFGSSRSWAAREARRKARLTAKKRRRSIIQATFITFSLLVFSISMWSLRKMRLSALSIPHATHRGNRANGLGRTLNGTMKTAVSALHAKVEMPKPPVEPESPVSKKDNSSVGTVHKKETTQESGGIATKLHIGVSTESTSDAGSRSQGRSGEDTSSRATSYDHDIASRSGFQARSEEGDANTNPAVRGMTQEDSISVHRETSRVYNERASHTNYGDDDVGKMKEVDMLDSEEGGQGLVITMPKKKSTRIGMRHRKEDMAHARDNSKNARREFAESGRRYQTGEGWFMDKNRLMFVGENHQNREKESYTSEAMTKPELTQREYKYTRRGSDETMYGEGFGRVYRRGDTGGIKYPAPMQDSLQRDGTEHRVATSNGDVSETSRFRN